MLQERRQNKSIPLYNSTINNLFNTSSKHCYIHATCTELLTRTVPQSSWPGSGALLLGTEDHTAVSFVPVEGPGGADSSPREPLLYLERGEREQKKHIISKVIS